MFARTWHPSSLIRAVLLSALVISCGGPAVAPAPVVAPAQAAEPAQKDAPAPAPRARPAPEAAPASRAPAALPGPAVRPGEGPAGSSPAGRPGGAPRGVALIEGGGLDLEQWLRDQNNECTRAGYPKECLAIRYVGEYVGDDPTDSRNKNCTVLIDEPSSFEQRDDTKYVKRDTPLTVNVSCDPLDESGDNPPDESGDNPPDESDDNPPDKSGGAGE